ncbi:MAG: alpha/beta fold hydrolase [Bacteroidota bacterium]
MKKALFFLALSIIIMVNSVYSEEPEQIALKFLNLLKQEKFSEAEKLVAEGALKYLSADKTKDFWLQLDSRYGKVVKFGTPEKQKSLKNNIYLIKFYFESDSLNCRIVVDEAQKISAMLFVPFARDYSFGLPNYADTTKFYEIETTFGVPGWELPAKVTIPRRGGQFPAVVLVHGSGPNDMDETIGGHKVFRDIAYGLSNNGIVVFRYEKRTREYPSKIAQNYDNLTVWEETMEDAIKAVAFLQEQDYVDPYKIYVLGHSLGGHIAPRIAQSYSGISGIIIMNGNARKLHQVVVDQYDYIFNLDGRVNDYEANELSKVRRQVEMLEKGEFTDTTSRDSLLLMLPAKYWKDLTKYDPVEVAKKLEIPILILAAENDYQILPLEFDLWKKNLGNKKNVSFKMFPKLNHLMVYSPKKSKPADYEKEGNVSDEVIKTIIEWIKKK